MNIPRYGLKFPLFALTAQAIATVIALVTVGFSFDDEPTVNSKDELTAATFE